MVLYLLGIKFFWDGEYVVIFGFFKEDLCCCGSEVDLVLFVNFVCME